MRDEEDDAGVCESRRDGERGADEECGRDPVEQEDEGREGEVEVWHRTGRGRGRGGGHCFGRRKVYSVWTIRM